MSTMERVASMDAVWLQIERDTCPMQLMGLLITATPIDRPCLEARLAARLLPLARFRQRVLRDTVGTVWETCPVDMRRQLVSASLPPGEPRKALAELIGSLAARPLDQDRPLWQLHLVEDYQGGSALIARVHQGIADAISITGLLRSLATPLEDEAQASDAVERPDGLFDPLYAPLSRAVINGITLSGAFWARYWGLLFNPQKIFDYACASTALALEIGKLSSLPDDSPTPLKGQASGRKRASWSVPLPFANVNAVAKAHKTTTDAVILATLAGAIHHCIAQTDASARDLELRTLMPVNLRSGESDEVLGNRSGLIPLELPIGIDTPEARLKEIDRRIRSFTDAYEAQQAWGVFSLIGQTPRAVQLQVLKLLASKTSALLYRVPAAPKGQTLCGARITEEMYWSPPPGDLGVTISIVNQGESYQIGVLADVAMLPEPAIITDRLGAELAILTPARAPKQRKNSKPSG